MTTGKWIILGLYSLCWLAGALLYACLFTLDRQMQVEIQTSATPSYINSNADIPIAKADGLYEDWSLQPAKKVRHFEPTYNPQGGF